MNSTRSSSRTKSLFIVESPGKVATIQKFLDDDFVVRATIGHIADLPENEEIDVDNGFACEYQLSESGKKVIAGLRKDLATCSEVILATDADREGEIIAWHVLQFLQPDVPVSRVTFQSITKEAVLDGLAHGREIDLAVVEAARTRRIIDRLFGFDVTSVTRRLIRRQVTAGRVQSPGLCLVVERELERMAFVAAEYMGVALTTASTPSIAAKLKVVSGRPVATGSDFDDRGILTGDAVMLERVVAEEIANGVSTGEWPLTVANISDKPATRNPQPPLDMSGLYQAAENRLGMSPAETKRISDSLYQSSLISYPRTDIRIHSPETRTKIRAAIRELFGADKVSPYERYTTSKKPLTQGAHEAIAPTNMMVRRPDGLGARERALYGLIWQRTLASQMVEATGTTTTVTLRAGDDAGVPCEFTASQTRYDKPGFQELYAPVADDDIDDDGDDSGVGGLPEMNIGDVVPVASAEATAHVTRPPARYVPASLIKELEERGIGRPSTYESIISKLRDRFVFSKPGTRAMIPTVTGLATYRLLKTSFDALVEYDFTRELEDRLDSIVDNPDKAQEVLERFYFGAAPEEVGLHALVNDAGTDVNPRDLYALDLGPHPETGAHIFVRPSSNKSRRLSPYLECDGVTVSISEETCFDEFTFDDAVSLLAHATPRVLGEIDGVPVTVRITGTGAYFQHGTKDHKPAGVTKPQTAPLLKSMDPSTVTLTDAITMFGFPREIGIFEDNGEPIHVKVGRYGPYVQAGSASCSLESEDQLFTLTSTEAHELLRRPKKTSRRTKKGSKK